MTKFQDLIEFVNRAERNRKYPAATAVALRAALNFYASDLTDEEASSLEKFRKDFDQISQSVFVKNANKFSAGSLTTYKSRVLKVMSDFEKYTDPAKMSSWTPKFIVRAKKQKTDSKKDDRISAHNHSENGDEQDTENDLSSVRMHKIEFALREDVKVVIRVPIDLSVKEASRVKALIDTLVIDTE